jgi:hypothetical protein
MPHILGIHLETIRGTSGKLRLGECVKVRPGLDLQRVDPSPASAQERKDEGLVLTVHVKASDHGCGNRRAGSEGVVLRWGHRVSLWGGQGLLPRGVKRGEGGGLRCLR